MLIVKYLYILRKKYSVKCNIRGLKFRGCTISCCDKQTPNLRFIFPLMSISMRMTSALLSVLWSHCSLHSLSFSLDPQRERERLYKERLKSEAWLLPMFFLPVCHYPEVRSMVPCDCQGLSCGLHLFPWKEVNAVSTLCKNKFPLKIVLIDFNLSYVSSLKKIFII